MRTTLNSGQRGHRTYVKLIVNGCLVSAVGFDRGTLLVTGGETYAWRFHGDVVSDVLAGLVPDVLARERAVALVGDEERSGPLPTWAQLVG